MFECQLLYREFPVCRALSGDGAGSPKGTRQGSAAQLQLQPFLLDALQHHQLRCHLRFLLPGCSFVRIAAAAPNSCFWTSCRDSCPGLGSCRPRNPGCSVPAMPALAARQKYGSHCCLPANEGRDLPGDPPMESGLPPGEAAG